MADQTQWRDLRRRQRIVWLVFLSYIPGIVILSIPLEALFDSETPVFVVAVLWFVALAVASGYMENWKCPRCGKPFFRTWWYHNTFAQRCIHCKLPKWSESY